ncbi:hypothetical protein AAC387_Pa03g0227 [Persea americana]
MPVRNDMVERSNVRRQVLSHLMENERICRDVLRMRPFAFATLCDKLRSTELLKNFSRSTIEEQVAKFLHVLGQNWKYRAIGCCFRRSSETISRHFHNVLRAIISLENQFLKQSYGNDVAPQILQSSRFDPYFKDCIGAIDGTHVRVKVSRADAPRFRGRKDCPTQNVLAACSFDMRFTYVLPGWEGTASDSRIMRNGLVRQDKLIIPQDPDEHLIHEVDRELQNGPVVNSREGPTVADEDSRLGAALRDNIIARKWNDYNK